MAKMILSMDGLILQEISLDKERMTIGRKPHNDIRIDNLAISGEHAVVVTLLSDSFLEDMNSTNGTLVNGAPIKKHRLKNNDVVELGKYKLKYIVEQPDFTSEGADYDKTTALAPSGPRPPVLGAASTSVTSTASDTPTAMAVIRIMNGANAGRELELSKTLTTLGKSGTQVAVIARRPQGYFITHVEGERFPVVNGKMLDAQAHKLADQDLIEIAGTKMNFYFKN